LSKFHTSPEWIQALWLLMVPVTLVGATACLMRVAGQIAAAIAQRGAMQGHPLYAIYEAPDGRWMLYAGGRVRDLQGEDGGEPAAGPALEAARKPPLPSGLA
jgi:hypothetical protein